MSTLALHDSEGRARPLWETPSRRALELADRLEEGAHLLTEVATSVTQAQWQVRIPKDGRTVGVLVHHVASVYPLDIQLAQAVAAGQAVMGVTLDDINQMNATHARMYDGVTKEMALDLLRRTSAAAATAIRALSDEQLDRVALVSLYGNAPVTCQFVLEDRAVRHAYHHVASIQKARQAHDDALKRLKVCLESGTCRPAFLRDAS